MIRKLVFLTPILVAQLCMAQAPAGAPAGATALCNDGTYSKSTNKLTACVGHKGNKTWFGATAKTATPASKSAPAPAKTSAPAPAPAKTSTPAPAPAPAPAAQSKTAPAAKTAAAAPSSADLSNAKAKGLVWVNLNTKVYHMSSASQYGTTKNGKFMSEADAKAAGYRAAKDAPAKGASK